MLKESNRNKIKTNKKSHQKLIDDNVIIRQIFEKSQKTIKELNDIISDLPKENEQFRIITQKRFNGFEFIRWITSKIHPIEVFITSYRIDEQSIKGILKVIKDFNLKITIVVSAFFTSTNKREKWTEFLIDEAKKNQNIKLIFCHNHTKIVGIKDKTGNCFIIEGSGNMSGNARIEQYLIEKSSDMFYFHQKWIKDIEFNAKEQNAIVIN